MRRAGGDGWSVAAALGLLAAAFLVERLVTSKTEDTQPKSEAKRDASAIGPATEGENSPSEIPAKGWKGVLLRVYADIGDHRILALAAGMTYYSILAIFPALAALVSIYGLFSDPGTIAKHLDQLSGFVPSGALDVAREQLTRVTSKGDQALGLTFVIGLAISFWSSNAAMKSLFDTLNIVYGEKEKRGFVRLNAVSLAFTIAAIAFVILALGAVVVVPVVLNYLCVGLHGSIRSHSAMARHVHLPRAGSRMHLPLRAEPRSAALALDHMGQRCRHTVLAHGLGAVLLVRRQFRQV